MKMHLLPVLSLSLLGFSSSVLNAQIANSKTKAQFQSSGSSAYVRQSDGAYVTDNRLFEFSNVTRNDGNGYIRLLLLKTIHNEHIDGHEETKGQIRVQAWTIAQDGTRKERWRFHARGNEGGALYEDRFFRITEWGCCDWPGTNWYFSLLSGKKLYVSNSDLLSISAPEGGPQLARYVGFGYYAHSTPPLLQYGTDSKVNQRFSVVSPREYYDAPKVLISVDDEPVKSLVLHTPFSFTILLRYNDGLEIRIPVQDDAIRPDRATFPQGYSLRSENVE